MMGAACCGSEGGEEGDDERQPRREEPPPCGSGLSLFGGPLRGDDKFTGAAVGEDGCLYAVPGTAKRVLRIDPRSLDVRALPTAVDGPFAGNALRRGRFKWLRGVAAADGARDTVGAAIYGIPCNSHVVLKIVPRTGAVHAMTHWRDEGQGRGGGGGGGLSSSSSAARSTLRANPVLHGTFKWHGAVRSPIDGNIYCIPANASRVLMIVPLTGEVRAALSLTRFALVLSPRLSLRLRCAPGVLLRSCSLAPSFVRVALCPRRCSLSLALRRGGASPRLL